MTQDAKQHRKRRVIIAVGAATVMAGIAAFAVVARSQAPTSPASGPAAVDRSSAVAHDAAPQPQASSPGASTSTGTAPPPAASVPDATTVTPMPAQMERLPSGVPVAATLPDLGYGTTPSVAADANASAKSVMEALKGANHPERLSPLVAPAPYDDAAFKKDPQAYCNTVEPGRVFQIAQPSADTPRLQLESQSLQTVTQGESVPLQVRGVPGKPVTFAAFDGGRFVENQLNVVTVVADADGLATARYEATAGVINEVKILAASPVASGQAAFCVYVNKKSGAQP